MLVRAQLLPQKEMTSEVFLCSSPVSRRRRLQLTPLMHRYFTTEDDGLSQDWGGETVFCNPPYGNKETGLWTKKCFEEAQKPGTIVVLLIPARTDRASFHDYIYNKPGVSIRFLRGRLAFEVNGKPIRDHSGSAVSAPFPSMIVEFKCAQNKF